MMHQVFVSYAHADSRIMQRVCEYLSRSQLALWTDEKLVPGTPSWSKAIEHALDKSKCLIVLLSPDAKSSDWVDREINYASSIVKIPIYPILVSGEDASAIPFLLAHTQYVDIRHQFEEPLETLANAIKTTISADAAISSIDTTTSKPSIKAALPQTEADIYLRSSAGDARRNWSIHSLKDVMRRASKTAQTQHIAGSFPVYGAQGVVEYADDYQYDGEFILLHKSGPSLISSRTFPVMKVSGQFSVKSSIIVAESVNPSQVIQNYLHAFLLTLDLRQAVSGFSNPVLSWKALGELPIALPPLEEQEHIVTTIKAHQAIIEENRHSLELELEALDQLGQILLKNAVNGQ